MRSERRWTPKGFDGQNVHLSEEQIEQLAKAASKDGKSLLRMTPNSYAVFSLHSAKLIVCPSLRHDANVAFLGFQLLFGPSSFEECLLWMESESAEIDWEE